jgi:hypothetical protein
MLKMLPCLIHFIARNRNPKPVVQSLSGILKQQFRLRGVHISVNRRWHRNRMLLLLLSFLAVQVATQSRPSNGGFACEGCIVSSPEL